MGFHKRTTVHGFRALASTILNEAVTEIDVGTLSGFIFMLKCHHWGDNQVFS
jgi:hypothetical protein